MQIRPLTASFGVFSVASATTACNLKAIRGYFSGGTDAWLQIHDAISLPANTAVPLRSFQLLAALDFFKEFNPVLPLTTGLVIAVSTTEATLTIATGGNTADIQVDIEETRITPVDSLTTAGDIVTGRDSLALWATGSGPKRLMTVDWTNGDAADRYLMLFAKVPSASDIPIQQWKIASGGSALHLAMGTDGMVPISQAADGTISKGGYLYQSSTATVLTATASAASFIQAQYK